MRLFFASITAVLVLCSNADAAHRFHHYRHSAVHFAASSYVHNGRPRAWCGWYMRQVKGVSDPSFNLARRWASWGHATSAHPGAVAVWNHHVGEVVAGNCPAGRVMLHSGNDGNAVRTRCVSTRGVIAFRDGGGGYERPARQEAYLRRNHYAGDEVWRSDYH